MVKTSGKRKGYKVFGLIDYFTGRFFYQGHEGRLNSESYSAFLTRVLEQTTQHIILIQVYCSPLSQGSLELSILWLTEKEVSHATQKMGCQNQGDNRA